MPLPSQNIKHSLDLILLIKCLEPAMPALALIAGQEIDHELLPREVKLLEIFLDHPDVIGIVLLTRVDVV